MKVNHHGEFAVQILFYIAKCAVASEANESGNFGLRRDQINRLRELSVTDVQTLGQHLSRNLSKLTISPVDFDRGLKIVDSRHRTHATILALIRGHASAAMLHELCGLSKSDVAALRRYCRMPLLLGRPALPSDAEQVDLWDRWQAVDTGDIAERYLTLYRETGIPLNAMWGVAKAWPDPPNRQQ